MEKWRNILKVVRDKICILLFFDYDIIFLLKVFGILWFRFEVDGSRVEFVTCMFFVRLICIFSFKYSLFLICVLDVLVEGN